MVSASLSCYEVLFFTFHFNSALLCRHWGKTVLGDLNSICVAHQMINYDYYVYQMVSTIFWSFKYHPMGKV